MARAPSKFRQGDVTRAVKGAIAAGVDVGEVLVDTDGKIRVIAAKANTAHARHLNEWDDVYDATPPQARSPVS
jgi:hypothetical protein